MNEGLDAVLFDFVLSVESADGGDPEELTRAIVSITLKVTLYRDLVVEGRKGRFVVYKNDSIGPFLKGRRLMPAVVLKTFIKDYYPAPRKPKMIQLIPPPGVGVHLDIMERSPNPFVGSEKKC